jgi:hypothetical protein
MGPARLVPAVVRAGAGEPSVSAGSPLTTGPAGSGGAAAAGRSVGGAASAVTGSGLTVTSTMPAPTWSAYVASCDSGLAMRWRRRPRSKRRQPCNWHWRRPA